MAADLTAQMTAGPLTGTVPPMRFAIRQIREDDQVDFYQLAVAGELDLLFHNEILVGFLNRSVPPAGQVVTRLLEIGAQL